MDAFINAIDVKVPGASCTGGTPVDEVHISRPYRRKTRQHDASRCGADAHARGIVQCECVWIIGDYVWLAER